MAVRMYEPRSHTGPYEFARLTAAGNAYLRQHRVPPPDDSYEIRADQVVTGDGLVKRTITCPETGRKTFEFTNSGSRKLWMLPYTADAYQQIRICNRPQTPAENAAFEASWRDTQAMLASGKITCQEI